MSRFRVRNVLPLCYLLGAAPVWGAFILAPPDGLGNVWLMVYTLPVVLFCTFVLKLDFPYIPGSYYTAHSAYFAAAVSVLTYLMHLALRAQR